MGGDGEGKMGNGKGRLGGVEGLSRARSWEGSAEEQAGGGDEEG